MTSRITEILALALILTTIWIFRSHDHHQACVHPTSFPPTWFGNCRLTTASK